MSELFCGVSLLRFFIGQNYTKHIECIKDKIIYIAYIGDKTNYNASNTKKHTFKAPTKTVDTGSNPVSPATLNILHITVDVFFYAQTTKNKHIYFNTFIIL